MIERIEDIGGFEKLKAEWNELLEASSSPCLFLTWEWLYTWWKHLSQGRRHGELLASDRKSTRLNSSHVSISYAVFCLKKKKNKVNTQLPLSQRLHARNTLPRSYSSGFCLFLHQPLRYPLSSSRSAAHRYCVSSRARRL